MAEGGGCARQLAGSIPMLTDSQKWLILAGVLLAAWAIYLLAPVLTPFLASAILAYLGDPLVDWLERRRIRRTLATALVLGALLVLLVLVPLLLVPVVQTQLHALGRSLPAVVDWGNRTLLPWLQAEFGVDPSLLEVERIKRLLSEHWQQAGSIAADVVAYITQSGAALVGWLLSVLLIPVVTFYMLRDWDHLMRGIRELLPRAVEPEVSALAREADQVLAGFLRGQLLVMLSLGLLYFAGLWLIGLELAFLVGMVAGLVSFVPYLGVFVGLVLASVAMLVQTQDPTQLVWVALVFGVGQLVEGTVLTPLLVGDRIGLHPVGVIFAVLAGGQLFGFVGVLLALPVAAVLAVAVRRAHRRYKTSRLYGGPAHAPSAVRDPPDAPP